ncbi:MAG: type II secretion system F family protein [Oligoflexia bacterium]|nr:type II secretion system F family protein [Oligoflexia bacterium]
MRAFLYQGKTSGGKFIKGVLEANSEIEARIKLRAQRIIPLKVVEKGVAAAKSGGGGSASNILGYFGLEPSVKAKDLQVFTRQFATMIASGIPIVQSIELLANQSASPVLKASLTSVKEGLESGKRLGDALEGWPRVFNRLYVSLVRAGEEGGVLDTILNRLALYIEKSVKIKAKITGAMWYPAGILLVSGVVIMALLTFVIPKFEELFKSSGQELPQLTQMVIIASHFAQSNFIYIIFAAVAFVIFLKQYYNSPKGRAVIDIILIKVPIIGPLLQKGAIARFTRTLSTMLGCGVGIIDALEICANVVDNTVVERALQKAKIAISEGKSITQPLGQEPYIPQMVVQMIGVGEATGSLDTMLGKIADFYEDEIDYAVGALTSIMEPIMMIFLGSIIAVLVVAMYLPIFNLANMVK